MTSESVWDICQPITGLTSNVGFGSSSLGLSKTSPGLRTIGYSDSEASDSVSAEAFIITSSKVIAKIWKAKLKTWVVNKYITLNQTLKPNRINPKKKKKNYCKIFSQRKAKVQNLRSKQAIEQNRIKYPNYFLKMFQLKIETLLSWGYMEIGNSNLKSRRGTVRLRKQKRNPDPSRAELQCLRKFWRLSNTNKIQHNNTFIIACTESMTKVSWAKLKSLGPCLEII